MDASLWRITLLSALVLALFAGTGPEAAKKDKKAKSEAEETDAYAEYVWPPPPDEPRIRLVDVIEGRLDIEAESKWRRRLLGASPASPYDQLQKPFGVGIDGDGRILVTDSATGALLRFDRTEHRMDVLGTQGTIRLATPLGMDIGPDGTIYVADAGLKKALALSPEGKVTAVFGKQGELTNPTDAAVGPGGEKLFVADSKAHRIVVFEIATGHVVSSFGKQGAADGEFHYPTSLAFGPEGNLFIVDQMNARVQVFTAEGDYFDQFGGLGVGFGDLVRPKDVAVDPNGFIYVTDNAFNNVQIFDADFTLLTFIGAGGSGPGEFLGASGVAARGSEFAVVDQLGHRLQLFRFLAPMTQVSGP